MEILNFTDFINESNDEELSLSLKGKEPGTVHDAVSGVIADYFGNDDRLKDVTVNATYSSYYQQDPNWKCWLTVTFNKSKVSKNDITVLKRLIKEKTKEL